MRARLAPLAVALALALAVVLSRAVEPGVRVESATLGGSPALVFRPAGPQARPVALLAHGVTASKETLFRLGEALAASGFTSVAIDLPGHGASREPFRGGRAVPDAIARAAQELGGVDVFVGHSMGAYAGAEVVRAGGLRPKLFVALGALPSLGPSAPPLLLLAGRFEEAVLPSLLRSSGAPLVVSDWSDHALEPYDPVLVDAAAGGVRSGTLDRAQARLVQGLSWPVVQAPANVTFSQAMRTASAKMGAAEAFDPDPVQPA